MSDSAPPDAGPAREFRGSPVPGCLILSTILIVFGGLIVLYTVVGSYQNRTIGTFTQDEAAALEVPTPDAAAVEAARGKLAAVGAAVKAGRSERILFTPADLNTLIASLDAAGGFRGNTRVEAIDETGLRARMAQPVRKGIFEKGVRFLNATFTLQPELRARTVAFKVLAIAPDTGEIPAGFVKNYEILDLFRLDPENPAIEEHIGGIAAVYTEAGHLVVETKLGE